MRKYEAVFILDPRKVEGNGGAFDTTIQETLKANGVTITDIDRTALYELCKPLYEEFANDRIPTELVEMVNAAK